MQAVRLEGMMKVPADYLDNFIRAELTFLYQWVFCPETEGLVNSRGLKLTRWSTLGDLLTPT